MVKQRRRIAAAYEMNLLNQPGIHLLEHTQDFNPSYYQFAIFLDERIDSDNLKSRLRENHGIECKPIYKPTHHESVFQRYDSGDLHSTTRVLARSLCLPLYPAMAEADVEFVSQCLISEIREQQ